MPARSRIDFVLARTVERGHRLLPDLAEAARLYMRLLLSFTAATWPAALYDELKGIAAGIPPDDRSLGAERAGGISLCHRDWVRADGARARMQQQWRALFNEVDVVLCPPMPVTAFAHDHWRRASWTSTANRTRTSTSASSGRGRRRAPDAVPIDRGDSGLPIGVQIVGPYLEDRTMPAFAAMIEREVGGFVAPPGYGG
jgi:amidase